MLTSCRPCCVLCDGLPDIQPKDERPACVSSSSEKKSWTLTIKVEFKPIMIQLMVLKSDIQSDDYQPARMVITCCQLQSGQVIEKIGFAVYTSRYNYPDPINKVYIRYYYRSM